MTSIVQTEIDRLMKLLSSSDINLALENSGYTDNGIKTAKFLRMSDEHHDGTMAYVYEVVFHDEGTETTAKVYIEFNGGKLLGEW